MTIDNLRFLIGGARVLHGLGRVRSRRTTIWQQRGGTHADRLGRTNTKSAGNERIAIHRHGPAGAKNSDRLIRSQLTSGLKNHVSPVQVRPSAQIKFPTT